MSGTEILVILMLVGFFALLMMGVPVALTLATTGFVFGFLGFGPDLFNLLPARIYGVVANYQWLAIPLFVCMGGPSGAKEPDLPLGGSPKPHKIKGLRGNPPISAPRRAAPACR